MIQLPITIPKFLSKVQKMMVKCILYSWFWASPFNFHLLSYCNKLDGKIGNFKSTVISILLFYFKNVLNIYSKYDISKYMLKKTFIGI